MKNLNHHNVDNIRHSAAHILAQAVLELFPGTQLTIGPTTETGFFYDFLPIAPFKEHDLPRIEERMYEIVARNYPITGSQVTKQAARAQFADNRFKLELIDGINEPTVGVYWQGTFGDLCRGGHTPSTGMVQHFKLMSISGSYWRADRTGISLQRITGIAFETKEELENYLTQLEEKKLYDHRRLGKELDLFSFHQQAPGKVFFHHKGTVIFNKLIEYSRKLQQPGYHEIKTPLIMHEELWRTSGHYENYKENMFFTTIDEQTYCVRPMNCPSSMMVYQERPHSYRELPLRIAEYGLVHRYELSGVLHGLFRVRSFTQDDAHLYCTLDQLEDELVGVLDLAQKIYQAFNFKNMYFALSTKPEKALGSDELWEQGSTALENALKRKNISFTLQPGEGAFYGPKIEMHIEDGMNRRWQCGTVQVDFFMPQRFNLTYITSDQSRKTPIIIHRAIYGSIERFLGILLEHTKGHFPFWLAPVQIRILTITDAQNAYAQTLKRELSTSRLRVEIDEHGDKINAQIKRAQLDKIPWMLVIGNKEMEHNTVTLRYVDGKQEFGLSLEQLRAKAAELTKDYV